MILSGKFNTIRAVVGFAQQVERRVQPVWISNGSVLWWVHN